MCVLLPGLCYPAAAGQQTDGEGSPTFEPQVNGGASAALFRALMTTAFLPVPHPHLWLQRPAHLEWPHHLTFYPSHKDTHKHTHTHTHTHKHARARIPYFDPQCYFCLNYILILPHFLDTMVLLNLPSVSAVWTAPSTCSSLVKTQTLGPQPS